MYGASEVLLLSVLQLSVTKYEIFKQEAMGNTHTNKNMINKRNRANKKWRKTKLINMPKQRSRNK